MDLEEQELLASFENNEWKSMKNIEQEKKHAQQMAAKSCIQRNLLPNTDVQNSL